jgi:hypothetical protein
MAQNPYRVNGLGLLKGYASDATYLSSTGTSPKRGDIYFNTTDNILKYYDGTNWLDLPQRRTRAIAKLFDNVLTSTPTGNQTIDSVLTVAGDKVLLAAHSTTPGIYIASTSAWTLALDLSRTDGAPTDGDQVWITDGTVYAGSEWTFDGSAWALQGVSSGTTTNSTLRWGGTAWVENTQVQTSANTIFGKADVVADAAQANLLSITGSEKAAGTGDGGNLVLAGGSSLGGNQGDVILQGYKINLGAQNASDPATGSASDIYYNTVSNSFKYYNGTSWNALGSGGNGIYNVNYVDGSSLVLPTGVASTPDGTAVVNGDLVLFTNLTTTADRGVYQVSGVGVSLVWTRKVFGQDPSGACTSGDFIYSKSGTAYNKTISYCTDTANATWLLAQMQIAGLRDNAGVLSVNTYIRQLTSTSGTVVADWGAAFKLLTDLHFDPTTSKTILMAGAAGANPGSSITIQSGQSGTGTDIAAGSLNLRTGPSTGAASSQGINFGISAVGASGATPNAIVDFMKMRNAGNTHLTEFFSTNGTTKKMMFTCSTSFSTFDMYNSAGSSCSINASLQTGSTGVGPSLILKAGDGNGGSYSGGDTQIKGGNSSIAADQNAGKVHIFTGSATGNGSGYIRFYTVKSGQGAGSSTRSATTSFEMGADTTNSYLWLWDYGTSNGVKIRPAVGSALYGINLPAAPPATGDTFVATDTSGNLSFAPGGNYMSVVVKLASISSTYTPTASDGVIACDASSTTMTINLPAASTMARKVFVIKKIDTSANTVIIDANSSELIDGALTKVLSAANESITIVCDSATWYII